MKVSIIDEVDKEIDFEFKNLNFNEESAQNLDEANENNNNEKQQIGIEKEDMLDTFSEVSSVRSKVRNKKRGGKFEKENFRQSRIDTQVLKKIPVFNEHFCDLSNNNLEEFPLDLIERIRNVKV